MWNLDEDQFNLCCFQALLTASFSWYWLQPLHCLRLLVIVVLEVENDVWPANNCLLWSQAAFSISTRNLLCFSFPVMYSSRELDLYVKYVGGMHQAATRACLYFLILSHSPQYQKCWLLFLMMKSYFFHGISLLFNKVMKRSHWLDEKTQNQQAYEVSNIYVIKHYNVYACTSTHKHVG